MAKTAIALIIAGSGATTDKEVFDLLEDAYPLEGYEEVGLIAPTSKDLHTDSVKNVLAWYDSNDTVYAIRTKDVSLSRATSGIGGDDGHREVEDFKEVLTAEEYKDWDEFVFLVAMPEDPEDPDYDLYAEMVEHAIENGVPVKNLCRGLDDVTLEDEGEPEHVVPDPEPEPEPEKPARKSRARKAKVEEVAEPEPESQSFSTGITSDDPPWVEPDLQEEVNLKAQDVLVAGGAPDSVADLVKRVKRLEQALLGASVLFAELMDDEPVEDTPEPEKAAEKPTSTRGRGRPRTNYEVPQIRDEDGEWIPRPKGRMRKGTEWRTIHAETNEVLDEGTA